MPPYRVYHGDYLLPPPMTATKAVNFSHSYAPRGACLQLFKCRAPEVLLSGPAGTGKSRACLEKLHAVALANPLMRGLIVRKTASSLTSSALVTFRRDVISEAIPAGIVHWYGGSAEQPPQYRYENGSSISIGGMDKASKILSTEYDVIYVQEATELTLEDWETLNTRCRNGVVSFQQMIADCNPTTANHWLRQRSLTSAIELLTSEHLDNPRLYDKDGELTQYGKSYMGRLENLTGVRRQRLLEGKWVSAEGIVYDNWDESVHVVDRFVVPDEWPRYWGIDWGYTNPTVIQAWAEDPDGRLYLYREIYHSQRLTTDHAAAWMRAVAPGGRIVNGVYVGGEWLEPRPRSVVADHDPEAQEAFRRVTGVSVRNADKVVGYGIQKVRERLRIGGDGKPRLFVMRDSVLEVDEVLREAWKPTSTLEEIPSYVWSDRKEDTPEKKDDHGVDALRYVVMAAEKPGGPRFRWVS